MALSCKTEKARLVFKGFVMRDILRFLVIVSNAICAMSSCNTATAEIVTKILPFSNQTLTELQFIPWLTQDSLESDARLLTVSVNATLLASTLDTFANDLTIYVDRLPLFGSGGRLQVGGTSNLQAANRLAWANGANSVAGTTVIDTKDVSSFNISIADAQVWYGNGFGGSGNSGTFTGTVSLTYFTAVPEPGSITLVCLGIACMAFRLRKRCRSC